MLSGEIALKNNHYYFIIKCFFIQVDNKFDYNFEIKYD